MVRPRWEARGWVALARFGGGGGNGSCIFDSRESGSE